MTETITQSVNSQAADRKQQQEVKEILAHKVSGTVKWFNVKSGYGFIVRDDNNEEVFIHRTDIAKGNPKKAKKSVGDNEKVEFDIVRGDKGFEAVNLTGPNGEAVVGSKYAPDKRNRRGGDRQRRTTGGESGAERTGDENADQRGGEGSGEGGAPRPRRVRRRGPRNGGGQQDANGEAVHGDDSQNQHGEQHVDGEGNDSQRPKRVRRRRRPNTGNGENGEQAGGEPHDGGRPPRSDNNNGGEPRVNNRPQRPRPVGYRDAPNNGQQQDNRPPRNPDNRPPRNTENRPPRVNNGQDNRGPRPRPVNNDGGDNNGQQQRPPRRFMPNRQPREEEN